MKDPKQTTAESLSCVQRDSLKARHHDDLPCCAKCRVDTSLISEQDAFLTSLFVPGKPEEVDNLGLSCNGTLLSSWSL